MTGSKFERRPVVVVGRGRWSVVVVGGLFWFGRMRRRAEHFVGFFGVLGADEEVHAVGQRHVRTQPAEIVGAEHRIDSGRLERRLGELCFEAIGEGSNDDEVGVAHAGIVGLFDYPR